MSLNTTPSGCSLDKQPGLCHSPCDSICTIDNHTEESGRSGGHSIMAQHGVKEGKIIKKETGKKKVHMSLTWFYCSKCNRDGMNHNYEHCPKWHMCCFCNEEGHWSFHCTTPHVKCTATQCLIHIGHRNISAQCPTSGISQSQEYAYTYVGEQGEVIMLSIFEDLDWESFYE